MILEETEEEFLADGEEGTTIASAPVRFRLSDANIAYRSSEPRILGRDDLLLAQEVEEARADEILPGSRRPSYIEFESKKEKREDEGRKPFELNDGSGLTSAQVALLIKEHGRNVLPDKKKPKVSKLKIEHANKMCNEKVDRGRRLENDLLVTLRAVLEE